MEPNLPAEPEQIAVAAPPEGGTESDNFFGFAESLEDFLRFEPSEFDISSLPLPPPSPSAVEFDFAASMNITPLSEEELSSCYPTPEDVGRSQPVESGVFVGHGTTDDGAGKKSGGVEEGSAGRRHRVSIAVGGRVIKKAMTKEMLDELIRVDPKKAKRIIANRMSAAKSKERKMLYANELEERVKGLQIEATSITAQVATVVRDNTALTARKEKLKMCIDAMQQEVQLRFAIIEQLKDELERAKIKTGMTSNPPYGVLLPQYYPHLALHQLPTLPPHHMVLQQPQFWMPPPPPPPPPAFGQPFNEQGGPSYSNFNPHELVHGISCE